MLNEAQLIGDRSAEAKGVRYHELPSDKHNMVAFAALSVPRKIAGEWSPYTDNGGTTVAIAGKQFVIVGGDTRLNSEYNFHTRADESKLFQLTPKTILASGGMQADRLQLQQVLKFRVEWYRMNNQRRVPSTHALSQLLATILYQRRFFPYYTFNVLAGLDDKGDGVCYSYDAVGCTEPLSYGTTGTGSAFTEPLLDCLIRREHQVLRQAPAEMTQERAVELLSAAFRAATERDIYTGDSARFWILTPQGLRQEVVPLRKD
jgi:20S proteasome subunit beta 6